MENKHSLVASIIAVIVVVIGAYLYTRARTPVLPATSATSTPSTATAVEVQGGSATVTEHPASTPQAPDFRTPLSFDASTSADVRAALTNQFTQTVAAIEKNATDFSAWVNLGLLRKMTGDYLGAKADWSYVAELYGKSTVATDNLGDLHMNFIKDYPQAEKDFKLSLANDPHDTNAYQQLVSLYTVYGYKGTSTALTLLEQGLKDNPGNQTLLQLQTALTR